MKKKKIIVILIIVFALLLVFVARYFLKRYLIKKVEGNIEETVNQIKEEKVVTENSYESKDLKINIRKEQIGEDEDKITYFVSDVICKNPYRLRRGFAKDQIGLNIIEPPTDIAIRLNAILSINGDFYGFRKTGIMIANGICYRDVPAREGMVFYKDGTAQIYDETKTTANELIKKGALNTLSFGPVLVKNGINVANYDKYAVDGDNIIRNNIAGINPRTAVGYYEKNHYCFVVVDGREEGYSRGLTLNELGQLFENLGCEIAYNLDGGGSSSLFFNGKKINGQMCGFRGVSDILYFY